MNGKKKLFCCSGKGCHLLVIKKMIFLVKRFFFWREEKPFSSLFLSLSSLRPLSLSLSPTSRPLGLSTPFFLILLELVLCSFASILCSSVSVLCFSASLSILSSVAVVTAFVFFFASLQKKNSFLRGTGPSSPHSFHFSFSFMVLMLVMFLFKAMYVQFGRGCRLKKGMEKSKHSKGNIVKTQGKKNL